MQFAFYQEEILISCSMKWPAESLWASFGLGCWWMRYESRRGEGHS